jgi:hypothetical protein
MSNAIHQEIDPGAHVTFVHTGFPDDAREHRASGWHANYREPQRRFLG